MKKTVLIFQETLPVLLMTALVVVIPNDYWLTAIYLVIISIAFVIKLLPNELLIFILGFIIMFGIEYIFVSTGVETFVRNSLFGVMPLWLPFLWGYGYVAIKRTVIILNN
jgi:hypothetical protein